MQVLFLLATAILPQISESIFSPCLPEISLMFSEKMSSVEHVFTTYLVGYAFGMFFWGSLSDYIGRIKALRIGIITYLTGTLLCYSASTLPMLLVFRFVQGLGGSACAVLVITLCRDYYTESKRAKMMAKLGMALSIGPMLGPLMGTSIMAYLPWYNVYIPLIIYALAILAATTILPKMTKPAVVPNLKHYYTVLTDKTIWLYAVLIGHACGIGFSFFSEAPFFFTEALGLPQKYFFLCFIIVGWAWYLGGNISQRLMKQYAIQVVMLKGIYLSACASILFCIAVCLFPASLFLVVVSLILIFLIMVGLGLVIGNAITLALEPFSQFSGVAASTLGFLYYSIIALVAFGMAELHNGTVFSMPFYWLHVIIICSLIVYYIQPEVDPIIKPIV